MPTVPKKPKTTPRKPAAPKTLYTPTQRRAKIRERLGQLAEFVEMRGGEANAATGFILKQNAEMLAESYGLVADEYAWFARYIDQMLTGGVWGQFVGVNLAVGIQIGLVRGWIDPEQLPPPLRAIFAPFSPPPPSDEVREAAERAARENGETQAPSEPPRAKAPPPRKPRSK